jgi:hypothetical protein
MMQPISVCQDKTDADAHPRTAGDIFPSQLLENSYTSEYSLSLKMLRHQNLNHAGIGYTIGIALLFAILLVPGEINESTQPGGRIQE